MTSPVSFASIAAIVFFAHVALSAELILTPDDRLPAVVRWLVRRKPVRNTHLALTTIPVLVGMQVLIGLGIAQPERIAGTAGVVIAIAELAASALWLVLLLRWRSGS